MSHFLQHAQLHRHLGASHPFSRWRGTPRGREMLSEAGHLQLEEGVQSQAPLLRNSSSASQAHMGLNSTGTRYGLPLQTV